MSRMLLPTDLVLAVLAARIVLKVPLVPYRAVRVLWRGMFAAV